MRRHPGLLSRSTACILLVDDDGNNPDVRSYYTQALDALGVDHNVWDLATQGDPAAADLIGYKMVIWSTGTPTAVPLPAPTRPLCRHTSTPAVLLFSSQTICTTQVDRIRQNYLHISSFTSDVSVTSSLGPCTPAWDPTPYPTLHQLLRPGEPDAQALPPSPTAG